MDINWDDFGKLKQSYSMVDDTHYGVPFDNGAVIACYRTDILEEAGYTLDDLTDITWSRFMKKSVKMFMKNRQIPSYKRSNRRRYSYDDDPVLWCKLRK